MRVGEGGIILRVFRLLPPFSSLMNKCPDSSLVSRTFTFEETHLRVGYRSCAYMFYARALVELQVYVAWSLRMATELLCACTHETPMRTRT